MTCLLFFMNFYKVLQTNHYFFIYLHTSCNILHILPLFCIVLHSFADYLDLKSGQSQKVWELSTVDLKIWDGRMLWRGFVGGKRLYVEANSLVRKNRRKKQWLGWMMKWASWDCSPAKLPIFDRYWRCSQFSQVGNA